MSRPNGFQSDLAAMQSEMASVARIVEASKPKPAPKAVVTDLSRSAEDPVTAPAKAAPNKAKRRSSTSVSAAPAAPAAPSGSRSNVTTRMSEEINQQLTEAALRQKLKRVAPDTRQDIIEEAVVDWLRKHGYGRHKQGSVEASETQSLTVDEGVESQESLAAKTDAATD